MKRHLIDLYGGSSTPNNFADNFDSPYGYTNNFSSSSSSYTLIPKPKNQKPKLQHYESDDDDDDDVSTEVSDESDEDYKLAVANSLRENYPSYVPRVSADFLASSSSYTPIKKSKAKVQPPQKSSRKSTYSSSSSSSSYISKDKSMFKGEADIAPPVDIWGKSFGIITIIPTDEQLHVNHKIKTIPEFVIVVVYHDSLTQKQVCDFMQKASYYELVKSDRKTKVPLLAYFVSKIIEYNYSKRRPSTSTTLPIFKKRIFFNECDYYGKIQTQIHRYQRKNKTSLIDHLIRGASKLLSEKEAENYTPDLFNGHFNKDPITDEDKPRLADELDRLYKSLYGQQQKGAEETEEAETPMENDDDEEEEEEDDDDDDDDGKDERNPPPSPPADVQQQQQQQSNTTTMEQLLTEGEIKPAAAAAATTTTTKISIWF